MSESVSGNQEHLENGYRIKILHLVDSGQPGGINSFVLQLLRAIDRSRFTIGVCSFMGDGPVLEEMRRWGAETLVLHEPGSFRPSAIWRYFQYIRSRGYRIVHANVGARIPRSVARLAGCRTIAHAHAPPAEWWDRMQNGDPELQRELNLAFGFASDAVVACSRHIADMLAGADSAVGAQVNIIHNGIDLDQWRPLAMEERQQRRIAAGLPRDAVIVGFAGRLVHSKRLDLLLAAAEQLLARHPGLYFALIGDGPLRPELEQRAAGLGKRLRFLGWRQSDLYLPLFDILAAPSESEGLPFSVLEAMACAIPVVASAVGGLPEAVIDKLTGFLTPPGDWQALAKPLDALIGNAEMRRTMGKAGRSRAERVFDSQLMARSLEELYMDLDRRAVAKIA